MRILFLIGRYPPEHLGGAELQAAALARRLAARGHDVTVLTSKRGRANASEMRDGYRIVRARTGRVPLARFFVSWGSTRRAIDALAPATDVLVCFQTFSSGFFGVRAARKHGLPCVVWVRGTGEFDTTASARARAFARSVYRRAGRVFVQSDRMRQALLAFHGDLSGPAGPLAARVRVVPNGVEIPPHDAAPGGGCGIVSLGRLVADKRIEDLIEAVRAIPGARLEIFGDGPERARLEKAAAGAEVRFGGRVEPRDVAAKLAGAAVVAHPALRGDGVPNVLLEAMSLGRPVVATATAGIPDIVRDGIDGILIAPGDVEALRAALSGLLGDEKRRTEMGTSAARRAKEFDWEAVLPLVEKALEETIASCGCRSK